ncbi:hypothetical protein O6H91_04G013000 [Diphasiastrum complanatum]|uniref:Uncharacterized protein n=1 Tax=Diphasiastrum complanatum TaxID=34168 RepID=A0ACC2DU81_DIPCM|nr:hypothetical protein O6H91_04G013000 [Diphasiastrum complanatum]
MGYQKIITWMFVKTIKNRLEDVIRAAQFFDDTPKPPRGQQPNEQKKFFNLKGRIGKILVKHIPIPIILRKQRKTLKTIRVILIRLKLVRRTYASSAMARVTLHEIV